MRKETEQEFETIGETTISEADTVECSKPDLVLGLRHIAAMIKERIDQMEDEIDDADGDEEEDD